MDKEYNKQVGLRLFKRRKELSLTRAELGKKLLLHESTIKRYEDGEIKSLDIDKIKDFAKALKTTPEYLMGWVNDPLDYNNMDDNRKVDKKVFGERLKSLLEEKKYTIYDLAKITNLSASTISRYINGAMSPKITTVKVIASHFGINPSWLMGHDEPKQYTEKNEDNNFPPEIRAVARNMMELNDEDRQTAIDMINFLSQKGKGAKDENS